MKENIEPINDKGRFHGHIVQYNYMDKLWMRGNVKNGLSMGYFELHAIQRTRFYIR